MSDIHIEKFNEVYLRISGERSTLTEMSRYFTFEVPGARFTPAYKNKLWDGYIKLLNLNTRCIYGGLYQHILEFADKSGYTVSVAEDVYAPVDTERAIIEKYINEVLKLYAFDSKIEIRDYQLDAIKHIIDNKRATIESPTSCHKKGDKVLMSTGLFKNIEEIVVGEYVIGNDGKHKKVLRVFSGENVELYDIIPKNSKNTKITVTGEHILPLKFSDYNTLHGYAKGDKDYIEYITVNNYLKKSNYYKHCANLFYNNNVLHFDNEKNPHINLSPYFIGCYIGDGSSYSCEITSADKEIVDEIYAQADKLSCIVKPPTQARKYSYKILGSTNKKNIIFREFERIGLYFSGKNRIKCGDRFIPFELINSTEDFRLELLAGLIDTDGYYSKGVNYEYTSKSLKLCEDVQLLAISLGFKTTLSSKLNKKHDKFYYTTRISGDLSKIPVRIPRKKHEEQIRQVYRSTYNKKFDVKFNGIDDFYGIEVEDHLYITNDGLVTHNSGKSLIIYASLRFLIATKAIRRVLLIFPTTGLVAQMKSDFIDYSTVNGWGVESRTHMIYSGQEKETDKQIVLSTYQSLTKMPISYYNQYDMIISDECHTAKSKSMTDIMERAHNVAYRVGFTGSLQDGKCHRLVIEGLFGKAFKTTTTKELISNNQAAQLKINCILLKYNKDTAKAMAKASYAEEIEYLTASNRRNNFIAGLTKSLKGNTLILFQFVDRQGKPLYELLKGTGNCHFIHGKVSVDDRDEVRKIAETSHDCIIVASYGTFSTGTSIKRIDNIIFASPYKSKIKVLQSVGRGLRIGNGKSKCNLYDIADDFSYKSHKNFTLQHFEARVGYYAADKFNYSVIEYQLEK